MTPESHQGPRPAEHRGWLTVLQLACPAEAGWGVPARHSRKCAGFVREGRDFYGVLEFLHVGVRLRGHGVLEFLHVGVRLGARIAAFDWHTCIHSTKRKETHQGTSARRSLLVVASIKQLTEGGRTMASWQTSLNLP